MVGGRYRRHPSTWRAMLRISARATSPTRAGHGDSETGKDGVLRRGGSTRRQKQRFEDHSRMGLVWCWFGTRRVRLTSFCASSQESKSANCVRKGTMTRPSVGTMDATSTSSPSVARLTRTPLRASSSVGAMAGEEEASAEVVARTRVNARRRAAPARGARRFTPRERGPAAATT